VTLLRTQHAEGLRRLADTCQVTAAVACREDAVEQVTGENRWLRTEPGEPGGALPSR
jgi:hypothetical protein